MDPEVSSTCQCCAAGPLESTEHVFCECPGHTAERCNDITDEEWQSLPNCLKLQGIMPRSNELLPQRWQTDQGRIDLAVIVQHNLLDMWANRCRHTPNAIQPQPRWGQGPPSQRPSQRNVRRRVEAHPLPQDAPAINPPTFVQGRDLQTGEHWAKTIRMSG